MYQQQEKKFGLCRYETGEGLHKTRMLVLCAFYFIISKDGVGEITWIRGI